VNKGGIASLALTLVGALLVAGCGGGGGGGDSSASAHPAASIATSSMSKKEYVRKANSICESRHRQLENEFRKFIASYGGHVPTGKAAEEKARAEIGETIAVPVKRHELEELAELGAPEGDVAGAKTVLVAIEKAIQVAEQRPAEVVTNNEIFLKPAEAAQKYGLTLNC
jgi:hypothetical protein